MNPWFPRVAACVLLATSFAAAESPLAGDWKFNKQKSQITGDTITFAPAPGGAKVTAGGMSYTFKPDGGPAQTPFGNTSAWTKVNDTTLNEASRQGSALLATTMYTLSDGGKTLTLKSTGKKPNGDSFDDTAVYTRVAPGDGFFGKWKSIKADVAITGYRFEDKPDGMLLWILPDYKATATMKADGRDYPATGPTVPPGLTISLAPAGLRRFTMVEKKDGKPIFKATETVSADGKTLTETGSAVGVNEPSTVVYDKQ